MCLFGAAEVIYDSHQSALEHLMTSHCLSDITAAAAASLLWEIGLGEARLTLGVQSCETINGIDLDRFCLHMCLCECTPDFLFFARGIVYLVT